MGEELVHEALKRGMENGKTSWQYVKGILKQWKKKGLYTVTDVLLAEGKYREDRALKSSARNSDWKNNRVTREVVPDWF